jgi:putative ABC transport system permease protein
MSALRYLWIWPWANLRLRRWMSACTLLGVGLVVASVGSLMGFTDGYERAVRHDVEHMGFDLLITARGCPYEAATLMLRGGSGLRYFYDDVVADLDQEPEVEATHPALVVAVRDTGSESGMMLLKGVESAFKDAQGLTLREGSWLSEESSGVVLGYEVAELEQRHSGDAMLIPGDSDRSPIETRVLGVLERTGTQADGTVHFRLGELQALMGMENRLSAVGIEVDVDQSEGIDALQERYESDPELQVIRLSSVVQSLQAVMDRMKGAVNLFSGVMVLVAAAFLLNAGLLRSLAEHRQYSVLRAIGLPMSFIMGACLVENLLLVLGGALAGLGLASIAGAPISTALLAYLPYSPGGDLIQISALLAVQILLASAGLAMLATVPAWVRLRFFTDVHAMRGA